jgi:hypothetical protein
MPKGVEIAEKEKRGSRLESCRLFLNHEGIEPRSHEEREEKLLCPAG